MAVTEDLEAARNLDFEPTLEIEYLGGPLPIGGSTISMEWRLYPGAAGAPLAADTNIEIVSDLPAADDSQPTLRVLTIIPKIPKAVLAALPGLNVPDAGDSQRFYQEIIITYADGKQDCLWIGHVILSPGVNAA